MLFVVILTWSEPPHCHRCLVHGTGCSAACPRDSPRRVLGHPSLVCTAEAQLPCQAHQKKGDFFSFSLSFCLFLNLPGLKQQLVLAWLQGLCHQQSTSLQLQKPRQSFLFPRTGVIWEDMTARKGLQTRRCFSVWSDEIFNPCSLWDMHHHRFTYLPLTDSSGWQGRWQLTYINPATQHKLSLQSRNPSLLFKHQGGVSVGTGYQAQAAPALKNRPRWGLSGAKGSRHSPEPR